MTKHEVHNMNTHTL